MSLALVRVQAKYRPVSGDLQGFRIQAALPNMSAKRMVKTSKGFRATDEDVPAFRPPFLLSESMDYSDESLVTDAEMARFKKNLAWSGFTEFQMIVKPEKAGKKLTPEAQAKIDAMLERLGFISSKKESK